MLQTSTQPIQSPTTPKPADKTPTLSNQIFVGPYKIEKTLGKGQTGLVKLGIHHKTGKKVAIKIVNREKLNESVLMKIEREITIMKLIDHPHVLKLYDVYENKKYLYLILEHVSGGELFDYLVRKGRLPNDDARKFFKQIISALDFCHSHLICHRDLKPENLLLDDQKNIKIADFGMASIQVVGSMLETSCGSPHYACPEVIRGEKYDGRKADVWSCGVILYALLVGTLPFDDDNLKVLLEKIKKGIFQIPSYIPLSCQELLKSMIEIDADKRISLAQVTKHPWVISNTSEEIQMEVPIYEAIPTTIIPSSEHIDTDVLANMTSLGCFKDRTKLIEELLSEKHNTEKVIYNLLLERKHKNPTNEDNDEVFLRQSSCIRPTDVPRKRIDSFKALNSQFLKLTIGSPTVCRRITSLPNEGPRYQSCHNTPLHSPYTSPISVNKEAAFRRHDGRLVNLSINSQSSPNSMMQEPTTPNNQVTPKIFKRKIQGRVADSPCSIRQNSTTITPTATPNLNSSNPRSWFQRWGFKNDNYNVNSPPPPYNQDKEFTMIINDRPLNMIKADLVAAFLTTNDLAHSITPNNPNQFRCEYRITEKFFTRNSVKFRVDILIENQQQQAAPTFKIQFILLSGSTRHFQAVCRNLCHLISTQHAIRQQHYQQRVALAATTQNNMLINTATTSTSTTNDIHYQSQSQRVFATLSYPISPTSAVKVNNGETTCTINLSSTSSCSTSSTLSNASTSSNSSSASSSSSGSVTVPSPAPFTKFTMNDHNRMNNTRNVFVNCAALVTKKAQTPSNAL